jgi:hypothetical protein
MQSSPRGLPPAPCRTDPVQWPSDRSEAGHGALLQGDLADRHADPLAPPIRRPVAAALAKGRAAA